MQTPLDYMTGWADGMRCWQAVCSLQSEPVVSAASARNNGLKRASELIAHARQHSPFYGEYYASIPADSPLEAYPAVTRSTLMDNFDEWSTDRRIDKESVDRFLSSTDNIGERYLDDYLVWTSSGTSGEPGVYIQDMNALSIYQSLMAVRYQKNGRESSHTDPWHLVLDSNRMAMVAALEGHFAGIVYWKWASRLNPWLASRTRTLSILQPVTTLVEQLNRWQPKFLSSYPSMLTVLANEQESGRLQLSPTCLWCGGEHLDKQQKRYMESAFDCKVIEDYGASEAMNMAFGCDHGRLHINTDWFILEPVDAHMQPVSAGEKSVTTLVTNLTSRVQPIIRYDIGDSITLHTDACDCGNPLPTLSVVGRNDDILWLPVNEIDEIPILPLALNTVIEEMADEFGFQINQVGPQDLSIRTQGDDNSARSRAYEKICVSLEQYFLSLGTLPVTLQHDPRPPQRDAVSGKLSQVNNRSRVNSGKAGIR